MICVAPVNNSITMKNSLLDILKDLKIPIAGYASLIYTKTMRVNVNGCPQKILNSCS